MGLIKKFRIKSYKKEENIVQLKNISVFYNKRQILDNLNLKIYKQEILGMLGPNGVGKSTIFNLITGLKDPNHGEIIIGGVNCTNLMQKDLQNLSCSCTSIWRTYSRFVIDR